MRFASAISDHGSPEQALEQLLQETRERLADAPVHLALWFASDLYLADWAAMARRLHAALGRPVLLGCSSGGVIGADQELEMRPGMSLLAAHLPDVRLAPFRVVPWELETAGASAPQRFWAELTGVAPQEEPIFLVIPDPMTCDATALVAGLNIAFPRRPIVGGLASSSGRHGGRWLILNDSLVADGAVGVAMTGNVTLETIVSQGCRPIGASYIITRAEEHLLHEIGSRPAVTVLQEILETLPPADQRLAQQALFLGIAMDERKYPLERGDFLIRNLMAADMEAGTLTVGERLQVGQTVQFHLRDARAATEDLQQLLRQTAEGRGPSPAGGVLFDCLGRGRGLFGRSHHDVQLIRAATGACPVGGFFCNGEIGPVGGVNYLHGYTASLGLFRPKQTWDVRRRDDGWPVAAGGSGTGGA